MAKLAKLLLSTLLLTSITACGGPEGGPLDEELETQSELAADDESGEFLSELGAAETAEFVPEEEEEAGPLTARAGKPIPKNPAGCLLTANDPHIRKSSNWTMVGAKPTVNCAVRVDEIQIESHLYRRGMGTLFNKKLVSRHVKNRGQKRLEQKNLEWPCANKNRSSYFASSVSRIKIKGKWYRGTNPVVSGTRELACGT